MHATSSSVPLVAKERRSVRALACGRCGGLLVGERCMDIGESFGGSWFWALRCIQCGDLTDDIILRNRRQSEESFPEVVGAA